MANYYYLIKTIQTQGILKCTKINSVKKKCTKINTKQEAATHPTRNTMTNILMGKIKLLKLVSIYLQVA
jgi:hypothetical protein